MPVYNVEKYIAQCVESLFAQTYKNIEFIFVIDGSQDNSENILRDIASLRPEFSSKIITKSNSGALASRRVGIEASSGDFISFCDSDDWIEPDMVESMIKHAILNNSQIVCSPYYINTKSNQKVISFNNNDSFCDINNTTLDTLHFSICNKLFARSIITDNNLYSCPDINYWQILIYI